MTQQATLGAPRTATTSAFKQQLQVYKKLVDADIEAYCGRLKAETHEVFGERSATATDAFIDILRRGGKRIRGALVMHGYGMAGGRDEALTLEAARAVEMMHAYILIIDDIQDKSATRRGGPTAHTALAQYHKTRQFGGDSSHFGISIALNSAILGNHLAQTVLAQLPTTSQRKLKVLEIINNTMVVTGHGQTNDIYNEVANGVTVEQLEQVLDWKTAHYTFINPLQVGMALAGASKQQLAAVVPYARAAGFAFQITDDVIGTFGEDTTSGKSAMDDTREGKRTLLTVYALKHATNADKNFLLTQLGNESITPAEFKRVKEILVESGALDYAKQEAERHVAEAIGALRNVKASKAHKDFLAALASSLLNRTL